MKGSSRSGVDAVAAWKQRVRTRTPPDRFRLGDGPLGRVELAPGRIGIVAGPPGAGKSAFVNQLLFDALRLNDGLKACLLSVEMDFSAILDRELACLSGVDLTDIADRTFGPRHQGNVDEAMAEIERVSPRLHFVERPHDLKNLWAVASRVKVGLVVIDYLQRVTNGEPARPQDRRASVDQVMDRLRCFAGSGIAILAVSAVSRGKDRFGGSSYEGLNLASLRESSELEFGADDVYLLERRESDATLRHLKARHGPRRDLRLLFRGAVQRFEAAGEAAGPRPAGGSRSSRHTALTDAEAERLFDSSRPARARKPGRR